MFQRATKRNWLIWGDLRNKKHRDFLCQTARLTFDVFADSGVGDKMKTGFSSGRTVRAAIAITILSCALTLPAAAHDIGDWVLAPWRDSAQTFPGVVVGKNGASLTIQFDDGTRETRISSEVRVFDWVAGSSIECQWSDGRWYSATVRWLANDGQTMQIRYDDDGTVERTNTGKCRSPN
jgi:hypothetical protein